MKRRIFMTLAAISVTLATPGLAGDGSDAASVSVPLNAAQIEALLAGNTIAGTWSGSDYKQYYGEDEFTMYIPEGGGNDEGKWRVNTETDAYESWWESTGWTPYNVVATNDGYAWVNGETLEPFDVFEGKQVSW